MDVVRRGYDAVSWLYRADDAAPGGYLPWIEELLAPLAGRSRVLDLGCGCGIPVAAALARAGHQVVGVDFSATQLERARRLVPGASFVLADATELGIAPRSFRAVVALYSIIHVPLSHQPALLRSIADWLVEDGILLLTAGWRSWTGYEDGWLGGAVPMWWSHADVGTYRRWLHRYGFEVLREEFVPEGESGHSLFWARRTG